MTLILKKGWMLLLIIFLAALTAVTAWFLFNREDIQQVPSKGVFVIRSI